MMLSWILGGTAFVVILAIVYMRCEAEKIQKAALGLYFVLSFEPLLVEEVYEMARRSGLTHLTRFLKGIPLIRLLYRIFSLKTSPEAWFYHEHVRLLVAVLEHRGLAKTTEVPITLDWLEMNRERLWAVPPERLKFWNTWASLMHRLSLLRETAEHEAKYQHYDRERPKAEMVQKRPWGRKTPPREVPVSERAWQNA